MTRLRSAQTLLLVSFAAVMSCGYAAAQEADKNPWMAEVAKAAALQAGNLGLAEQAMRLCKPSPQRGRAIWG